MDPFFIYIRTQPAVATYTHIRTHTFSQLVEQRQKSVELNKLGRHRCLHSFGVVIEEKERQSFCTQKKGRRRK